MKPNETKSNRDQRKRNDTNYIIEYITLQNTTQYNKHYNPNREDPKNTERNETKEKTNETKQIQIKSNQHYNTTNNKKILNFTRIRILMTL